MRLRCTVNSLGRTPDSVTANRWGQQVFVRADYGAFSPWPATTCLVQSRHTKTAHGGSMILVQERRLRCTRHAILRL